MQAVVAELAENGYAGTTVERVAQRAGIAKTTIYRRWAGLDGLLAVDPDDEPADGDQATDDEQEHGGHPTS